jgi:hypothetical protein
MLAQLTHKRNTELADLIIALPLRIEIRSSFAAANIHYFHSLLAYVLIAEEEDHVRDTYSPSRHS